MNNVIGGTAGDTYLIVGDIGTENGSALDFIYGQTFLDQFYLVLVGANNRIGFAYIFLLRPPRINFGTGVFLGCQAQPWELSIYIYILLLLFFKVIHSHSE